jgi:hypothetical protein
MGSCPEPDESSPVSQPVSLTFILVLLSNLYLDLQSCFFPSGVLINILFVFIIDVVHAICPAYVIILDLIV